VTPPSPRAFASLLGRLDAPGLAALFVAVRDARGADARVADGLAVVDGERVLPWTGRAWPTRLAVRRVERALADAGADAVVVPGRGLAAELAARGVAVHGPDEVRTALLYGLDRATADRIARTHLDRPLSTPDRPSLGARLAGRAAGVATPAAVVLAALVVAATLVGGGGLDPDARAGPGAVTPASAPATAVPGPSAGSAGDAIQPDPDREWYAPGLTPSGISSPTALADGHEGSLAGDAHEWRVSYREYGSSARYARATAPPTAVRSETVRVDDGGNVTVNVTGVGELRGANVRFVHPGDADEIDRGLDGPTAERYVDRSARYVATYLSAPESRVVGRVDAAGERRYAVVVSGDPVPGVANYTAAAVVSQWGAVLAFAAQYESPATDRFVRVSFQSRETGESWVVPPSTTDPAAAANVSTATGTGTDASAGTAVRAV
jgi:hypothetical protein